MSLLHLVMIVKDAEDVIQKTLQAVKPFIDRWTILDTGSSDQTIQIIKQTMKGKTGNVYQEPFVDFSTSRNRALDLAGQTCKYTLMLDDSYILHNGEALRKKLSKSNGESFEIAILDNKNRLYYSKRILRTAKHLRYKYRVHEVVQDCNSNVLNYFSSRVYIYDNRDTNSELKSKQRIPYYLKILTEDHQKDPTDKRIVYFLAHTYFSSENYTKAIEFYQKRICLATEIDEEVYMSQYMIGCSMDRLKQPSNDIIKAFEKAYEYDNIRAEPLYQISVILYRDNKTEQAFTYLQRAYKHKIPTNRLLQVEYKTYSEEIPVLLADISLQLGKKDYAKTIVQKTLKINPNSTRLRNINDTFREDKIIVTKCSVPLIVFHSGVEWKPNDLQQASGSEIMTVNIAKELVNRKYRVVVFVNNIKDCVIDSVEYKDSENYHSFLEKYYVDVLIVSRYVDNLVYPESVQKVYLWLHDLLPHGNSFHTHELKFKSVLCLSEWHKKFFCKEFNFPSNMVKVTRNAVDIKRFDKDIKTVPYRFIYTSNPNRGLENLIKMWPKIYSRYPNASLYIFVTASDIPSYLLPKLNKKYGIYLHDRLNQEEIAIEFLKSDVWLYPTTWRETYCITAVEAQISRTLCVAYKCGSLSETVGNRGILANNEEEILKKLFLVLERPILKHALLDKAEKWARQQDIVTLVDSWQNDLFK